MVNQFDIELQDNTERKYTYKFDSDIMNPYILRTFLPFVNSNNILEIGAYTGNFTKLLAQHFDRVYAIEPSVEAFNVLKKLSNDNITLFNINIENFVTYKTFDNVVLSHVLEHLDNREKVIDYIVKNLLSENGHLIIAVPNANALSRQISVEMGIMSKTTDVTEGEKLQGHKTTFSLESLMSETKHVQLREIFRGGVMIKQLANFQWDLAIGENIVSKEFFEASFKVGQKYPDLCASLIVIYRKSSMSGNVIK